MAETKVADAQSDTHAAAQSDVLTCFNNIQNFLGSNFQSHANYGDIQACLNNAQQNPAQAAAMLTQIQALQNQIFATDPLKAVGAMVETELQKKTMTVLEPVTNTEVTKAVPVTDVNVNIGDTGGSQSLSIVMTVPHNNEQNYKPIAAALESVLSEKFPAVADLQQTGKGSWHGENTYKLDYAVPAEVDASKVVSALLHGESLKPAQAAEAPAQATETAAKAPVVDFGTGHALTPEQVAERIIEQKGADTAAGGVPAASGFAKPELLKATEPTSIKPDAIAEQPRGAALAPTGT